MKNIHSSLILSFVFFMCVACSKDTSPTLQLQEGDYLVFGHFYGFCMGNNCIVIYKLQNKTIWKDTTKAYPSNTKAYLGKYIFFSTEKYERVKDLIDSFPQALLAEKNNTIGMPDVTDGGGLYIEYYVNGVHKFWLIDQLKNNVPSIYHTFMDKVNEKIKQCSN